MPVRGSAPHTFRVSKHFKNISVVAAATMVSRVLGLGRDMLVTTVFGVGPLASAFYTAFTLPNLFRRLLGEGALTAAFVPTLNEELEAHGRSGALGLVNQVASWLFVVSGGIVALALGWAFLRLQKISRQLHDHAAELRRTNQELALAAKTWLEWKVRQELKVTS